jgi:putative spermidine/putrescine transport system permease protein
MLMLIVLIPFWTSMVVRTFAWVVLLQDSGPIGQFMKIFGVEQLGIMRTPTAVLIGMAQVLLPFVVLPMYATMSKIDTRLLTAARSLGARPSKAFVSVYLPLALPGVASGALLSFVMALGFYITPAMLGSSRDAFLSTLIQGQVQGLAQWGYGAVIGFVLLFVTMVILGLATWIGKKTGGSVQDMVGGSKA